jgi:glucosamine-6-phosphate deaminase
MDIRTFDSKVQAGQAAASQAAELIRAAIAHYGEANIIVATGASQFEVFSALVKAPDIAWNKVTGFHLDEYVHLPIAHPASFRKYLWERFVSKLPLPLKAFHFIDGEGNPDAEAVHVGAHIENRRINAAMVGIGENGHLAFNDPPADFATTSPYIVVELDEPCRRQQLGEGWFNSLEDVPKRAISMSIRQILASDAIVCCVPDQRKAIAVKNCLEGPVSNLAPASILQTHKNATVYLDRDSASLLSR